jgi:hypothetical protein
MPMALIFHFLGGLDGNDLRSLAVLNQFEAEAATTPSNVRTFYLGGILLGAIAALYLITVHSKLALGSHFSD